MNKLLAYSYSSETLPATDIIEQFIQQYQVIISKLISQINSKLVNYELYNNTAYYDRFDRQGLELTPPVWLIELASIETTGNVSTSIKSSIKIYKRK